MTDAEKELKGAKEDAIVESAEIVLKIWSKKELCWTGQKQIHLFLLHNFDQILHPLLSVQK